MLPWVNHPTFMCTCMAFGSFILIRLIGLSEYQNSVLSLKKGNVPDAEEKNSAREGKAQDRLGEWPISGLGFPSSSRPLLALLEDETPQ